MTKHQWNTWVSGNFGTDLNWHNFQCLRCGLKHCSTQSRLEKDLELLGLSDCDYAAAYLVQKS